MDNDSEYTLRRLLGKLGYLRRVCLKARLLLSLLLILRDEGQILKVTQAPHLILVTCTAGYISIDPRVGVVILMCENNHLSV